MFSTNEAHKAHVYISNPKGVEKKFGRVRSTVFHPEEPRAIGYIIKRPDALLMVKRADHFVALDRIKQIDQGLCIEDKPDTWDKKACARLDVDFDQCILWELMPVRMKSGREIGAISNVVFNETTGEIDCIDISASVADKILLGNSSISRNHIIGYQDGAIIVDDINADMQEAGGVAAKAGEAWAKTKHVASEETKKVAKKTGEVVNEGAYKAGEVIGTVRDKADKAAKAHKAKKDEAEARGEYVGVDKAANLLGQGIGRATGMFKGFKEEFDKASHDE